jgi:signal transduction histidine kinase
MPHPGLRGRIAVSLVLIAAVALGVAAFALLSPLERKLRTQEVRDLVSAAVQSRADFSELDVTDPHELTERLSSRVRRIASVTGARVVLLDAHGHVLVNTDPDARDAFRDTVPALRTDRAVRRIVSGGSVPEARVAVRIAVEGKRYVLALRKPLTEQRSAAEQVQHAFAEAALVALAVSLLVAGLFAATVGRRVRALRAAVLKFHLGGRAEELPHDRSADEVGDLARAFADMARRLRREEEVRREFVSTASHELRTPLMTLQGRLELLADELARRDPNLPDSRGQLAAARDQADRLGRLAADLLDLSRLDAEVAVRNEEVDLAELVRAVAAEFGARFDAQGRELETEMEPVHVIADPSACARIVRVLLDNALRYSRPGAPVEVRVERDAGRASVKVSDGGPGIPAADAERIFERFARGSGTNPAGGFGLGLAIARELATRMGGALELTRNSSEGTTFTLRLPVSSDVPNEIPTEASLGQTPVGKPSV